MSSLIRFRSVALALAIFFLAGCGPDRLDVTKKVTVSPGDAKAFDLPAQKEPQTVNIEFSTSGEPASVLLFKEDDAKGEDNILLASETKALGKVMISKGDKFSAEVPANTATRVIVRAHAKSTEVTVKINNRK
jgi:hypothetical protein